MRYLMLLVSLCMFISSCKTAALKPDLFLERPGPRVELDNGKIIEAKTVTFNKRFLGPADVTADTKVYSADSVAFYSTGMDYFANVGKPYFAPKIINGRINVFRTTKNFQQTTYSPGNFGNIGGGGHYSYSQQTAHKYYVQAQGTKPVLKFSYESLASMIPSTAPEFHLLTSYKRTRRFTRFGLALGGAGIAGGALLMPGSTQSRVRVLAGGIALSATSFLLGFTNYSKLTEALVGFNSEKNSP